MPSEVFVPFLTSREGAAPVTQIKGTWLVSSIRTLRAHGYYDRYVEKLPDVARERVLQTTPQEWVPAVFLDAHYLACEALEISQTEAYALGLDAVKHSHQSVLAMTARLAQAGGVTPWSVFGQFQKMWDRIIVGGDMEILKLGPKEATIEVVGLDCLRFRYCKLGVRGVLAGLTELFCQKAYVNEARSAPSSVVLRIAWA
jgi:hypothetical protein